MTSLIVDYVYNTEFKMLLMDTSSSFH